MPIMTDSDLHAWWLELRHQGLVIAPALLDEYFSRGPQQPSHFSYQRLRERYAAFDEWYQKENAYEDGVDRTPLNTWLDAVLETFLGHERSRWQNANYVDTRWKHRPLIGEPLIPRRVLFCDSSQHTPAFFVCVEPIRRLQYGRKAYGKLLQLLRAKQVKFGLLTNGRQFRLCYAGLDHDSWVEWDCENWFAEEELRPQLYGFYTLLGQTGIPLQQTGQKTFPLLEAAEASRTRQGELSTVLGEQVRQSVETLLNDVNRALQTQRHVDQNGHTHDDLLMKVRKTPYGEDLSERRLLDALYQAAVRIIMRMVIIFFAEARDMLPLSLQSYAMSYSLEGLYEQLQQASQHEGADALDEQYSAWTRMLSLFKLIYEGSVSNNLPVRPYGGLLFRPGDFDSPEAVQRAVALFESGKIAKEISDHTVFRLLKLLKIGKMKVKHKKKPLHGPVDFRELRTEYIGLMYQGLLDFHLRVASEPIIILKLGQEPLLPLQTLEDMSDARLKELLKKLEKEKISGPKLSDDDDVDDDDVDEAVSEETDEELLEEVEEDDVSDEEEEQTGESLGENLLSEEDKQYQRAIAWAKKAVVLAGLVKKPRGKKADDLSHYDKEVNEAAHRLVKQVLGQSEFYLTRRGGTRKGSGTFYTRPQLAVPIARRALWPLLYTEREDGTAIPRLPEELLNVKVCDPACGSGAFLVAALHYLTDALFESLVYHRGLDPDIQDDNNQNRTFTLPFGTPSRALPRERLIPVTLNNKRFTNLTKAQLRRYVVEQCIYGVDLSPLAVELARISLWIETMDHELPFTFLDHKIKVGNALVGGWFNSFREYPIMAWQRDGGDSSHKNGVTYHTKEWTKAIQERREEVIKPALITQINSSLPQLFSELVQETPEGLFREFTDELLNIHALPIEDTEIREERYRALRASDGFRETKYAFDRWCAAWFWPADKLDKAPQPDNFYHTPNSTHRLVEDLAEEMHFFHWELEFLDVFNRPQHGFDAILANPPWEVSKPSSKEFFSDYDLFYRTYGKQDAEKEQSALFQRNPMIEREWLLYRSQFKSMGNWTMYAASPFGDPTVMGIKGVTLKRGYEGIELHKRWRERRAHYENFADSDEPFRYQGSADLNTYKMFLEVAYYLLRTGGRLGLLVPSGVYTDKGSATLRALFLNKCCWEMLFGFINYGRIFEIDNRFKFAAMVLEKGKQTEHIRVTFNQQQLADFEYADQYLLDFPRQQVYHFSPHSLAIIELQTQRDKNILEKLYTNIVLLGDQHEQSWKIQYAREFDMTNDSKLFPPLPNWEEALGYRPDDYGRWVNEEEKIALPLYEGRMVGQFDPCEKSWISGKGRGAEWTTIPFDKKNFKPQYLLSLDDYTNPKKVLRGNKDQEKVLRGNKIGFMDIASATNMRSMYATFINDMPCGNVVPVLQPDKHDAANLLSLIAILNSFSYDYAVRCRLGGLHLNYFVVEETPLIPPSRMQLTPCAQLAASLNLIMPSFAPQWLELRKVYPPLGERHWRRLWAITRHERLRLRCILDAIIAELYGLEYDDFAWILRDGSTKTHPKGFWRVDQRESKELRHTTLALEAFQRLKEVGLVAFFEEDWQFSAEVAVQLGSRFTPWQEELSIVESWEECEMHALRMQETPIPLPEIEKNEQGTVSATHSIKAKGRNKKSKIPKEQLPLDLFIEENS